LGGFAKSFTTCLLICYNFSGSEDVGKHNDLRKGFSMPSQAYLHFAENKKDIEMIWHIYAEVVGSGKSKLRRVDVLNRSAIVFISACWESYVEDVATESFDFMIENSDSPDLIPNKVKVIASKELHDAKDERRVWELAGTGWKKILLEHRELTRAGWLKDFNTPKSRQVSELFSTMLDVPNITSCWTWQGMSSEEACKRLDDFITIRGNIAHRTKHDNTVYKSVGKNFLSHVVKLVENTDLAVYNHLCSMTASSPWQETGSR